MVSSPKMVGTLAGIGTLTTLAGKFWWSSMWSLSSFASSLWSTLNVKFSEATLRTFLTKSYWQPLKGGKNPGMRLFRQLSRSCLWSPKWGAWKDEAGPGGVKRSNLGSGEKQRNKWTCESLSLWLSNRFAHTYLHKARRRSHTTKLDGRVKLHG